MKISPIDNVNVLKIRRPQVYRKTSGNKGILRTGEVVFFSREKHMNFIQYQMVSSKNKYIQRPFYKLSDSYTYVFRNTDR